MGRRLAESPEVSGQADPGEDVSRLLRRRTLPVPRELVGVHARQSCHACSSVKAPFRRRRFVHQRSTCSLRPEGEHRRSDERDVLPPPASGNGEVRAVNDGARPSVDDVAAELGVGRTDAEGAFRRLEEARVLIFSPGSLDIWMANPLCTYPTSFWVETPRGGWWGTCIWDAFGIPAMLREDATISTHCPDCEEPMELRVADGQRALLCCQISSDRVTSLPAGKS